MQVAFPPETSCMSVRIFVDTNVLVYARDQTDEAKHRRAMEWMSALWQGRIGSLSWQVLQEYYVTVTGKLSPPRSREDAREDVASLVTWRPVTIDLATIDRAWDVEDRCGFSWWDSLIVAAAQLGGCSHLLSEDLQDGQSLDGLTVISPFSHDPTSIIEGASDS